MRYGWWFVCAVACGGDKDSTSETGAESEDDTPVVIDCDLPSYDLEPLTCSELAYTFKQLLRVASACNTNADCRIVSPACNEWDELDCYYAGNTCFDDTLIASFNAHTDVCQVYGPTGCSCTEPPVVTCVSHTCELEEQTP